MSETQLVLYSAMRQAIAACHAIDEVKDIHDKALALEIYHRQARNVENETKACEIRLRSERKAGQLLAEREMAKPGPAPRDRSHAASDPQPLAELGITHTQSSRWQKLAAIPEDDFEATFAKPGKKSTSGIIREHCSNKDAPIIDITPQPPPRKPVDPRALWLWGRLLDFEREGILTANPDDLFDSMLPHMKEATLELAPAVISWLERLVCCAEE